MSKLELVLPLGVGRLILLNIGKVYNGHPSQNERYYHVVKEVRYPTPVGYSIERQMKHPDTGENLIFELTVSEGKLGPWYTVRAFPESRDMTREEKVEGRSPTSVGNLIYEKMKIRSKVSGPVFFGWEVKEICYLFQQLEEGNLNVTFDHTKKNTFQFPPSISRKREASPSRSAQRSPKKRRMNPEEDGGDSEEDLEAEFAQQQQHSSNRRLRLALEAEAGPEQSRAPGESSPYPEDGEVRKRKKAKKRSREDREADEADRERQQMIAQMESQIYDTFEDGREGPGELGLDGEQGDGWRDLVLSDADRLRKKRAEEKIRWVISVEEKSKRRPKKRQEWKEKMEQKLKRLCTKAVTKAAEMRIAYKLKRLN